MKNSCSVRIMPTSPPKKVRKKDMTTIQLRDYERDRRQRRLARKSHQKRAADRLTKNKKERDRYRKKAPLHQIQSTQTPPAVPTKASLHTLPAGYTPSIGIIPMRPISEVRASWQNSPSSTIIVAGPEESSIHSLSSPHPSHFPPPLPTPLTFEQRITVASTPVRKVEPLEPVPDPLPAPEVQMQQINVRRSIIFKLPSDRAPRKRKRQRQHFYNIVLKVIGCKFK